MISAFLRQRILWLFGCLIVLASSQIALTQLRADQTQSATALSPSQLIQPEELVKVLQSAKTKPLILNVGPRMLYVQAHIPAAEYIGAGSDPESINQLRARVQSLSHTTSIVLYCGCCPWIHCPNVNPAYTELHNLGFTNVKVLYIANNLGTDWVYKGYPTVLSKQ